MRRLVWVLWGVTACSFDASGVGPSSGNDAPPGTADANVDAMVDASTVGCTCMGDKLKCPGTPDQTCSLGCSAVSGPHCEALVPSNGVSLGELTAATAAFATTSSAATSTSHDYTIDTDTGEILDYGDDGFPLQTPTVVRAAVTGANAGMVFDTISATISVLAVDSVDVASDSTVFGFGSRALVILSRGDVSIQGNVDFSAGCYDSGGNYDATCAGPGGGSGSTDLALATGCGPGGDGQTNHSTGGGGGAMGAVGGGGGDPGGNKGGVAGTVAGCPNATLVPLAGGGGGGAAAVGLGGFGGGGGGALQITSLTKIGLVHPVASTPTQIFVGGSGGRGTPTTNGGGGGGGAGGGILLEAPMVVVHATLAANGGGGGGGRTTGTTADGQMGTTTLLQALGGAGDGAGMNTGRGGLGGAANSAASQGIAGSDGTGGGGGGIGRIRINAKGAADTAGATISPNASTGSIVLQ